MRFFVLIGHMVEKYDDDGNERAWTYHAKLFDEHDLQYPRYCPHNHRTEAGAERCGRRWLRAYQKLHRPVPR